MNRNYYVYVHICKSTGNIFYVGKGKGNRAYSTERNERWAEYVKKHQYFTLILYKNKTEGEALVIERRLINEQKANGILTNIVHNRTKVPKLTYVNTTLVADLDSSREEKMYKDFLRKAHELYGDKYSYPLISSSIFYLYKDNFGQKKYDPVLYRDRHKWGFQTYGKQIFLVTCNTHNIHFFVSSVLKFLEGDWSHQCDMCAKEECLKHNIGDVESKKKTVFQKQIVINKQVIDYQFYYSRSYYELNRLGVKHNN